MVSQLRSWIPMAEERDSEGRCGYINAMRMGMRRKRTVMVMVMMVVTTLNTTFEIFKHEGSRALFAI